ncbi:PREDICTED: uncharacterized protein LOC106820286, partial [Priapulus caudatus]|uniref:Uncharacterized protein LOC106820286 n=1 Tax=Priapulus caudatus TaxID=37621 RepID=A0ABM1F772_PRICU
SYQPVLRYSYNSTADWQEALLIVTVVGIATDVRVDNVTGGCSRLAEDNAEFAFTLAPGFDTAWVSNETLEMDARCVYDFTLQLGQASSDGNASTTLTIDSLLLLPNTSNFTVYQLADDDQQ